MIELFVVKAILISIETQDKDYIFIFYIAGNYFSSSSVRAYDEYMAPTTLHF